MTLGILPFRAPRTGLIPVRPAGPFAAGPGPAGLRGRCQRSAPSLFSRGEVGSKLGRNPSSPGSASPACRSACGSRARRRPGPGRCRCCRRCLRRSVPPGWSRPRASASRTMYSAARSFTEPPGLRNSPLPRISQPVSSDALRSSHQRRIADQIDEPAAHLHRRAGRLAYGRGKRRIDWRGNFAKASGMKIVVLDGHTLNPGDNPWDRLARLGELDRLRPHARRAQVVERAARRRDRCSPTSALLGRSAIDALPRLRFIAVLRHRLRRRRRRRGAGAAAFRFRTCRSTAPTPSPSSPSPCCSSCATSAGAHAEAVRAGEWSRSPDFCFWKSPQVELAG